MKILSAMLLLVCLAGSSPADEAKAPAYPAPGVDLVLTKGAAAKDFFAARAADAAGRATLAEAKAAYKAEKLKLDSLIKGRASRDALDAQEQAKEDARHKLLVAMEQCGPCATDEVKSIRVDYPAPAQYWYVLDGSYQIEAADKAQRAKKVHRLKQLLLAVPAKKDRLRNVIDFVLVDNETGELLENARTIEHSPFFAFSAVGRPVLGGVLAYDFYTKGVFKTTSAQPAEFMIRTEVVPRPKSFSPPVSDYVSYSGKKYPTHHEIARSSLGMTYLNTDGYLRIWNATAYGSDIEIGEVGQRMMRRGHLDILVQLDETLERVEAE